MIDLRKFATGGMDQDTAWDSPTRDPNDYDEAFNFRTTGTGVNEAGNGTNPESNLLISSGRPAGINKGIGSRAFENVRKAYNWIYNSQGYHLITEVDSDTKTETVIYTNLTDSGGVDAMPLNPDTYVTEIVLIDHKFLGFIDSYGRPCLINLERLKSGGYGVLTYKDFSLLKPQPVKAVLSVYGNDTSRSVNLLRQGLFQFNSQFVYLDDEHSAWSMMSKRNVPVYEGTTAIGTDVTKYNHLVVHVNIGTDRVKRVNVGARTGLSIWSLIKSIDRDKILAITDTEVDVAAGIRESYDPTTNLYSFAFYNDALYVPISALETDLLHDAVPEKAGAMEVVNSNLIALADITEGKPRPDMDVTFTVSSYDPGLKSSEIENADALKVRYTTEKKGGPSDPYQQIYLYFTGKAKTGDEVKIAVIDLNDKKVLFREYNFEVLLAENDDTLKFVQRMATEIPYASVRTETSGEIRLTFSLQRFSEAGHKVETVRPIVVDLANVGDGTSTSILSLKQNSAYQLAFAYYDEDGNPFPLNTSSDWVVQTPPYAQLKGQAVRIDWQINSEPPAGAKWYNILISENNTHENTLYVLGKEDGSESDYIKLIIDPLQKFNENNNASVLSYSFTPGDRATLHYYESVANVKTWFDGSTTALQSVDVEVLDFSPVPDETDESIIHYTLKIRKSSSLVLADLTGNNVMVEIYTPKRKDEVGSSGDSEITTPFFETGDRFEIIDGAHVQTFGNIIEGDSYLKTRQYVGATDPNELYQVIVEDFNFSDSYPSKYYSYGRPRTYFDVPEELELGASIRYGDIYNKGSQINGLTRFYLENIYGDGPGETSSSNGSIMKMSQRGGYLVIIQEINSCHLPVYKTIWEDAEGRESVAVSTKIFGSAQYNTAGNRGMGDSRTAFARSKNGTIYFIDPNHTAPMRDGYDGLKDISHKMSKFFRRVLTDAFNDKKKVILYFDDEYNELIVTMETEGDVLQLIPVDSDNIELYEDYEVLPGDISLLAPSAKGDETYNSTTGNATYTPDTASLGSDNFTFEFDVDGVATVKRACILIAEGDKTIDQFQFVDVSDIEPSAVVESNGVLITGNNVPVPYTVAGGEVSINGGAWTSAAGYVRLDDQVKVRGTASASYETAVNVVFTAGDQTDTFTITTKVAPVMVPVSYSIAYGVDPVTQNGLIFMRNGVEVARFGSEGSGSPLTMFHRGETFKVRHYSYGADVLPWEASSKANMTVAVDAGEVFNADITVQAIELQEYEFVIGETVDAITVTATGSSTAVGYITKIMNVDSDTTNARIKVTDTTPPKEVLEITNTALGVSATPYNLFVDANTQTVNIENLHPTQSMDVTVNGGSVVVIAALANQNFTGITKDSVSITISQPAP